jgi:hypothetical protein
LEKNRIYRIIAIACFAGYGWLGFQIFNSRTQSSIISCPIKRITGIPCPSCGSTRSVVSLLQGNLSDAIQLNPLGLVVFILMLILPLWMLFDWFTKQSSFYTAYLIAEKKIRKKSIAIPLILLITINWIWNFYKFK